MGAGKFLLEARTREGEPAKETLRAAEAEFLGSLARTTAGATLVPLRAPPGSLSKDTKYRREQCFNPGAAPK